MEKKELTPEEKEDARAMTLFEFLIDFFLFWLD